MAYTNCDLILSVKDADDRDRQRRPAETGLSSEEG